MLTLEGSECKDIPKATLEVVDPCDEQTSDNNYEQTDYAIATGRILRSALLSPEPTPGESQDEDALSEHSSGDNESDVSNDWDELKSESLSYTLPGGKEFLIITQFDDDGNLIAEKLENQDSSTEKSVKAHYDSKQNKVVLLRKLLPKHEPIVEIKEEEHAIIDTEMDDCVSNMDDINFEESSGDKKTVGDNNENIGWLKSFRPLPLHHTERGKPYLKCPACGAMFFTSSTFQNHLFTHMYKEDDTFICSFCNYSNTEAGMLFAHLSKHQDQCEFCNENLMRKNNFEKHWDIRSANFTMKRDRRGRFVCTLCKLVFDLLPQLEKHWFKHACKRERTYQCKECSGLYESIETLNNHKCMKCPVCGKVYDSLHRLKAHTMWTKHNLKCPICSYEFILAMDHEKHLALHRQTYRAMTDYLHCLQSADGKTFQCNLCDKLFYALSTLILHLQEDHDVENVKTVSSKTDEEREIPMREIILRGLHAESSTYHNPTCNEVVTKK